MPNTLRAALGSMAVGHDLHAGTCHDGVLLPADAPNTLEPPGMPSWFDSITVPSPPLRISAPMAMAGR